MRKFLLGFIIGVVILVAFVLLGGAKYLKEFGSRTETAAEKLEKYEKDMKKTAEETKEKVSETAKDAKEAVDKTVDKTKETVSKTTEKVKEYMPK